MSSAYQHPLFWYHWISYRTMYFFLVRDSFKSQGADFNRGNFTVEHNFSTETFP